MYLVWIIALIATGGSLAFSEFLGIAPCSLCWYQRILMYPLVLLVPVGILKKDFILPIYILALSILGTFIAFYHTLLQWGLLSEVAVRCSIGADCSVEYWSYGFVTIPFLSLASFLLIAVFAVAQLRRNVYEQGT